MNHIKKNESCEKSHAITNESCKNEWIVNVTYDSEEIMLKNSSFVEKKNHM